MAGNSQKYNASINFGASVDPSMSRTLNRMTAGIDDIGTETAKVARTQSAWQRQMKAGSASTVNQIQHMERATQALLSKQEALEKEIRESVKNGRAGTAFLIADYKKVGAGIERAREEMERLNAEQKREQQLEERSNRRRARWDRVKAAPMGMAKTGLSLGASAIGLGTAGVTGLVGGVLALNHKTAEEYRLAKQYGMSFQHYKAGSILAEQAGLNGENYGDLTEELSNKVGEVGNDKTINPMLAQIGLNKQLMKGTKQQQFDTVMQAITAHIGNGKGQLTITQASSLADQLMGGEANKLVTYIASTGKSYEEVMRNAALLNNITEEEARGAMESSLVISNMWTSAETALQGIAGELGNALRPQLEAWEKEASEWVRNNKEKIAKTIGSWVDGGGPQRLVSGLETFGRALSTLASAINTVLPDNSEEARQKKVLSSLGRMGSEEIAANTAHKEGLDDWFNQNVRGNKALFEQVRADYTSTRGTFWDDDDGYSSALDSALNGINGVKAPDQPVGADGAVVPIFSRPNPMQQNNNVQIVVNAADGQSPEEIGKQVYQQFANSVPGVPSDLSGSDTFDHPSY